MAERKIYEVSLREGQRNYYRIVMTAGFIFFPLWAITYDFTWASNRLILGMYSGLIVVLSYRVRFVRERIRFFLYGLIYLATIISSYQFYHQSLDPLWALYHTMVYIGFGLIFRRLSPFLAFIILYTGSPR